MFARPTPKARRCGARYASSSATAPCRRCPMAKKSKLRLVSSHDPASVFDDLGALHRAQTALAAPAFQGQRRQRSAETFARIPHDRARRLYHLRGSGWALLIQIHRLNLEGRGRNPVRLTQKPQGFRSKREKKKIRPL